MKSNTTETSENVNKEITECDNSNTIAVTKKNENSTLKQIKKDNIILTTKVNELRQKEDQSMLKIKLLAVDNNTLSNHIE